MRIVSLLPSATEMAATLGLEDKLVAISHECDFPQSVGHLPRITGSIIPHNLTQKEINDLVKEAMSNNQSLYTVNGELLRSLEPDLILTQGICDVCAVTPHTIEASLRGVSCQLSANTQILSFEGTSFQGIFEDLRALGRLTDRETLAEKLIGQAQKTIESNSTQHSTSLLLLEWIDPPFSAGHWVPEQIEAAGFRSAIGKRGDHSRTLTWNEIKASNPDVIGVICCGFDLESNRRFASQLRAKTELEWFKGPIIGLDANSYFSRPTIRVVDGIKKLRTMLDG